MTATPEFGFYSGMSAQDWMAGMGIEPDGEEEPMHLFAQPYNEWLSLCGQTIPSGAATIEVYEYRRGQYCADCLEVK